MKVLIADDHALFRDGLSMQLEKLNADSVVFQAGSFSQALKILSDEKKLDLINNFLVYTIFHTYTLGLRFVFLFIF